MSGCECTKYHIKLAGLSRHVRVAVLADLHGSHGCDLDSIMEYLRFTEPDIALFPGDTFERLDRSRPKYNEKGFELVKRVSEICPVYLSVGNHENGGIHSWNLIKWRGSKPVPHRFDKGELTRIQKCGGVFLDDGYVEVNGVRIGGLSSGLINENRLPRIDWLDDFCKFDGTKILMCHHPEYYEEHLYYKDIDLVVSGHAHGGQWRIFGKGIFAPGQGIFPKYTQGLHHGNHVISRGLKRGCIIPRLFNKPEVVIVDLAPLQYTNLL